MEGADDGISQNMGEATTQNHTRISNIKKMAEKLYQGEQHKIIQTNKNAEEYRSNHANNNNNNNNKIIIMIIIKKLEFRKAGTLLFPPSNIFSRPNICM